MHNSGTSLLGGLLNSAGVPMGNKLLMKSGIPKHLRPRYDYFEDKDIVDLQDKTLVLLKRHWSSYKGSFSLETEHNSIRETFQVELSNIIKRRLKNTNLWAVKDPRSAILLKDWVKVLTEMKIQIKLLIVHRDPLRNIKSFSEKGQVPMLWAEALWQRTYINTFETIRMLSKDNYSITNFEDILENPEREVFHICKFLNWKPAKDLEKRIHDHIDMKLPSKQLIDKSYEMDQHTIQLTDFLNKKSFEYNLNRKAKNLPNKIKDIMQSNESKLGLNSIYESTQTLQPKVKVIIITAELQNYVNCGGIGSAYYELANSLIEAGHSTSIILVNSSDEKISEDFNHRINILKINPNGLTRIELNRVIYKKVSEIKPDVIHVHDWLGLGSGLKNNLLESSKVFIGLHGPTAWTRGGNPWPREKNGGLKIDEKHLYEEGLIRALEEDSINNADLLISPSEFMLKWVKEKILQKEINIVSQRNCTLSKRLINNASYNSSNQNKLIFFGRLEARKGLKLFLKALEQLKSKPAKILFVGSDCYLDEGTLSSELIKSKLNHLNIEYEFQNTLNRLEALQLIEKLKYVVVIPSIIENSPCVLEELLDSNLRVVTTDTGGIKEMVREVDRKWLAKPNPNELAHHLNEALTNTDQHAYLLRAKIDPWKINLSWQAFHERIPRNNYTKEINKNINSSIIKKIKDMVKKNIKRLIFNDKILSIR